MELYITRHGKTEWNIEGRFQGVKDSPLVKSGIMDAHALRDYLADVHFDAVFSSPLGRAVETANLLFSQREDITVQLDQRIQEMNFGVFEGMKTTDILQVYPDIYDHLWNQPEQFERCPGGGESFAEVRARIISFLSDLDRFPDDSRIFIVTHGMYFICLLGYLLGYDPVDFPKINRSVVRGCSLTTVIKKQDDYQIIQIGDDHFLTSEAKDTFLIQQKKM